MTTTYNDI